MAVYAAYVQKQETYQGAMRTFGNTYHFNVAPTDGFPDITVLNDLIAAERKITSSAVEFIGGRTWGPVDGLKSENVMREELVVSPPLLGLGVNLGDAYREIAALVVWPLPRSQPLNRRRWLRKFIRLGVTQVAVGVGAIGGTAAIAAAAQNELKNYGLEVTRVGTMETLPLCAPDGSEPTGPAEVRPYFTTREIGR